MDNASDGSIPNNYVVPPSKAHLIANNFKAIEIGMNN